MAFDKPTETAFAPAEPAVPPMPEAPGWREVPLWDAEDQPRRFATEADLR